MPTKNKVAHEKKFAQSSKFETFKDMKLSLWKFKAFQKCLLVI